ncbi:hypothetical protein Pst134EB_006313 [Puccinia striiformis f. sp. tritici]|nr:hypothetical protein Pst134EB_006313 [Puccinia striiformis f. sp. tritici]
MGQPGSPRANDRQRYDPNDVNNNILNQDDSFIPTIILEDIPEDPEWITLPDESDDDFDEAVYTHRRKWQQMARDCDWEKLLGRLHPHYVHLKIRTNNWSNVNTYADHTNCKCPPHLQTRRPVDLVDINAQYRASVVFCKCTEDGVRLLQTGFLPASALTPQTAFSLPLMIFHNSLWNNCHIGVQPFTRSLKEWLEPRSERLWVRKKKHLYQGRDLRKPFSAAIDLFRTLKKMSKEMTFKVLRLDAQEIQALEGCAGCFGPQPPNAQDYPSKMRNKAILCLDANFQHRHHSKAGNNDRPIDTPRIFIPPSKFTEMKAAIQAKEIAMTSPGQADRCADSHKAADDKRNESTWKGCDDTGLMGLCCRHDAAIYMGNIFKSGEQRCLPVTMINELLTQCEADRPIGILYDIGCSLDKYMGARELLAEHRPRLSFGTSVFHAYVHNWVCQLQYHPRLNDGWGLSDGEGLERLWSYLSPLVSNLRYSTRNHRLAAIAHRLEYHNLKGQQGLAAWLKRKFNTAVKRRDEARWHKVFREQWEAQRKFHEDHTEAEEERRSKLVSYYQQEVVVELLRKRLQGPEIFLATEQEVLDLLDSITQHSAKLRRQLDELTREPDLQRVVNDEEAKLLLMLWDAKAQLFVQAVQYQAEQRPITDSRTIGARTGTVLKESVFKAQQTRKPAVKKVIDSFNRCYSNFITKYPDQTLSDAADYPLTYEKFIKFPMDHRFWNDGLYYHSKAPWAIDANVRAGITATLTLSRVQEEFQLLAQELCRAVGWGVAYYNRLSETMSYLNERIVALDRGEVALQPDHIDALAFAKFPKRQMYKLLLRELRVQLASHGTLMDEWSGDVEWLWKRCQPLGNRGFISEWNEIIQKINDDSPVNPASLDGVDEEFEETILDVDQNNGEDVEDELIRSLAGVDIDNDSQNAATTQASHNVNHNLSNTGTSLARRNINNNSQNVGPQPATGGASA